MPTTMPNTPAAPVPASRVNKPNESGSISVQAHMRIYDPKTQKTYVEGRA
jgi:hypothetical protein